MKSLTVIGVIMAAGASSAWGQQASRAYQSELLADADARTSLLAAGTAGYTEGKGFGIEDGANSLYVSGFMDWRYIWNNRSDDSAPGANDQTTLGFQNGDTKLKFHGNIGDEVGYVIQLNANDWYTGGAMAVEDAYGTYAMNDNTTIMFGQFKLPVLAADYMVDDPYVQGVERGVVNEYFTPMRSQGIAFAWEDQDLQVFGSFNDGWRSMNTDFNSAGEADFALTGRVNFKWAGDWDSFATADSFRGSEDAGYVGGAIHWQTGGETNATTDVDIILYTVDAAYQSDGWSLRGAFVGSNVDPAGGSDYDTYGINVQGGYFFNDQFEGYASWDGLMLDDDVFAVQDDFQNFLTVGGKYFVMPNSHAFVLNADVIISLTQSDDLAASGAGAGFTAGVPGGSDFLSGATNTGLLGDTDTGEFALRLGARVNF